MGLSEFVELTQVMATIVHLLFWGTIAVSLIAVTLIVMIIKKF